MRIVSGTHRGRQIVPPAGFEARPTTDFAKEALFNILAGNFEMEGVEVLDLFSGTGSIAYEFASRGCQRVDSVELNFKHFAFIKKTAALLNFNQMHVYRRDVFAWLRSCSMQYDIVFADPPYEMAQLEEIPTLVFEKQLLKPTGWLILEHGKHKNFETHPHFLQHRSYGSVNFSVFQLNKQSVQTAC